MSTFLSAVLILVMVWVSVVVGTRTGSVGQLSTAWLTVVAAAAGPGAYLLPGVGQREPDLGRERRVVGVEVGEEDVPA
jgi:steroid 5-alpha reductase family enzyme